MALLPDVQFARDHAVWRPVGESTWPAFVEQLLRAVMPACRERLTLRLLVDLTGLQHPPLSVADRYGAAEMLAGEWDRTIRLAVVGRSDQIDPARFGVLVAVNRGLTLRAALDEVEALEWLLSSLTGGV
jgi:hypothetical protein